MANRFFYLWRFIWLFGFTSTLIFYSSPSFSSFSVYREFTSSDFPSSTYDFSQFSTSSFHISTTNLASQFDDSGSGVVASSEEVNFYEYFNVNLRETLSRSFVNSTIDTLDNIQFLFMSLDEVNISFHLVVRDSSGITHTFTPYLSFSMSNKCASLTASDIYTNFDQSLHYSARHQFFTDFPNNKNNLHNSCIYSPVMEGLISPSFDPPVNVELEPAGCFLGIEISFHDVFSAGFPYIIFNDFFDEVDAAPISCANCTCNTIIKDTDKDGIPDSEDLCPFLGKEFGDLNESGCPAYKDVDNDGIPEQDGFGNSPDKCPNTPADKAGTVDASGCLTSPSGPDAYRYIRYFADSPFDYLTLIQRPSNVFLNYSEASEPSIYTNQKPFVFTLKLNALPSLPDLLVSDFNLSHSGFSVPSLYLVDSLIDVKYANSRNDLFLDSSPFLMHQISGSKLLGESPFVVASNKFQNVSDFLESTSENFIQDKLPLIANALGLDFSSFSVTFETSSEPLNVFDSDLCKNVPLPSKSVKVRTYSGNAPVGSPLLFDKFPATTLENYRLSNDQYLIKKPIVDDKGMPVLDANGNQVTYNLKSSITQKDLYTSSQCADDLRLLNCYNTGNFLISESGFLSCTNNGETDLFNFPKYVSSGVSSPSFSDALANNQTLSDLKTRSFSFGSTSPPCPVYNFDFSAVGLGFQSVTYHCELINQFRLPLDAMFYGLWSFIAVRVFLSA